MVKITIQMVIALIADLPIKCHWGDQSESMNFEYLLPFGCKLVRQSSGGWAINHYAYDQSDYKKLQSRFNYLPVLD